MPDTVIRSPTVISKIVASLSADNKVTLSEYIDELENFIYDDSYSYEYEEYRDTLWTLQINKYEMYYYNLLFIELDSSNWLPDEIIRGVRSNIVKDIKESIQWQKEQ